jgi:hypothetical protein
VGEFQLTFFNGNTWNFFNGWSGFFELSREGEIIEISRRSIPRIPMEKIQNNPGIPRNSKNRSINQEFQQLFPPGCQRFEIEKHVFQIKLKIEDMFKMAT